EDLAVADFSGRGTLYDGIYYRFYELIIHDDFDLYLWQKVDAILVSVMRLDVAFLPPMSAHFVGRHAVDTHFDQSLFDSVEPGGLNDRFKLGHFLSSLWWDGRSS